MTGRRTVPAGTIYGDALAYSRAVCIGDDAWVAGCAPFDEAGAIVGEGEPYAQARQCLSNISRALTEAGFSPADVVRTRIYLRRFEDADAVMRAHREMFETICPACTVVAVADLVRPEMLVYMDADARRTEQPRQAAPTSETSANHDPLARFQVGDAIGSSGWVLVSQDMIDRFGAVTHDPDPMHIDPAWARANGPFGGAIAFGFLTLSLLTYLFHQAVGTRADREEPGPGLYLNYGFDRVRLLSPVRAGSQVRGHFTLSERRVEAKGRLRFSLGVSVEVAGEERPALVADWLAMWTPHEPSAAG